MATSVQQVFKVDDFEFKSEDDAQRYIKREAYVKKVEIQVRKLLNCLNDIEYITDDPMLVYRLDPTSSYKKGVIDPELIARGMVLDPTNYLLLIEEVIRNYKELNNIPA